MNLSKWVFEKASDVSFNLVDLQNSLHNALSGYVKQQPIDVNSITKLIKQNINYVYDYSIDVNLNGRDSFTANIALKLSSMPEFVFLQVVSQN